MSRSGGGRERRLRISRQRYVDRCAMGFWHGRDLVDAFRPVEVGKGISNAIDVIWRQRYTGYEMVWDDGQPCCHCGKMV